MEQDDGDGDDGDYSPTDALLLARLLACSPPPLSFYLIQKKSV